MELDREADGSAAEEPEAVAEVKPQAARSLLLASLGSLGEQLDSVWPSGADSPEESLLLE